MFPFSNHPSHRALLSSMHMSVPSSYSHYIYDFCNGLSLQYFINFFIHELSILFLIYFLQPKYGSYKILLDITLCFSSSFCARVMDRLRITGCIVSFLMQHKLFHLHKICTFQLENHICYLYNIKVKSAQVY